MAVNARGTMLCYKHAAKQMIAQGRGGRIIGANSFYLFFWPVLIEDVQGHVREQAKKVVSYNHNMQIHGSHHMNRC